MAGSLGEYVSAVGFKLKPADRSFRATRTGLNTQLVHWYQKFSAAVHALRLGEENYLPGRVVYGLFLAVWAFESRARRSRDEQRRRLT